MAGRGASLKSEETVGLSRPSARARARIACTCAIQASTSWFSQSGQRATASRRNATLAVRRAPGGSLPRDGPMCRATRRISYAATPDDGQLARGGRMVRRVVCRALAAGWRSVARGRAYLRTCLLLISSTSACLSGEKILFTNLAKNKQRTGCTLATSRHRALCFSAPLRHHFGGLPGGRRRRIVQQKL